MKINILCISFICCLALQANAQTTNTIVNDGSAWSTLSSNCCIDDVFTIYHFFDGDSVFNEKTYKKLFRYNDEQHTERYFSGLMREENKKTYFVEYYWDFDREEGYWEEILLYDFSLEQGDIFEAYSDETLYVLQSDSVLINDNLKKRLIIAEEGNWVVDTIIENIGSLQGLFHNNYVCCNSRVDKLLCYTENGELVYQNPEYTECYYNITTSVETIESNYCSISPNPVDDILHISCLNKETMRIEIFDNAGRQVYNQAYKESVDINSFSKGLYFLKLYDANGQVSEFKFIKK